MSIIRSFSQEEYQRTFRPINSWMIRGHMFLIFDSDEYFNAVYQNMTSSDPVEEVYTPIMKTVKEWLKSSSRVYETQKNQAALLVTLPNDADAVEFKLRFCNA